MYNRSVLIGRLVADAELRHTQNDVAVASFTVAANRPYKVDGKDVADFIECVAWRNTAEFVCKYFSKGKPIGVEGALQKRSYDGKDGIKRWTTEIVVDRVFFVGDSKQTTNHAPLPDAPPPATSDKSGCVYANGNAADFEEVDSFEDLPF